MGTFKGFWFRQRERFHQSGLYRRYPGFKWSFYFALAFSQGVAHAGEEPSERRGEAADSASEPAKEPGAKRAVDLEDFSLFRRVAEQGDATAQFHLGVRYDEGRGVEK